MGGHNAISSSQWSSKSLYLRSPFADSHADLLKVFKMKIEHSVTAYDKFFDVEKHRATRGHSWKIHKQRYHLDPRTYFFTGRVADRWNKLE